MGKIPKVIHYCWFGENKLPYDAVKCIESWRKYMPDYQIIEWNESNYDIGNCEFVKEACLQKKWAFVTDYARLDVIYNFGGIYFDTDVEAVKPFDELLDNEAFAGFDDDNLINTGMGFGAAAHNPIIRENKDPYQNIRFINTDGSLNLVTCPYITSDILKRHGAKMNNSYQQLDGITLYPREYFCPLNYYTGKLNKTVHTFSIHNYSMSWVDKKDVRYHTIHMKLSKIFGRKLAFVIVYGVKFIFSLITDFYQYGFRYAWKEAYSKFNKLR